jgi:hypothetical protein
MAIPLLPFWSFVQKWLPTINWTVRESELLYDWRFTAHQFVLATSSLRLTTTNFSFQLNTCGYNRYVTSSLMREWVCRLQLLLVLANTIPGPSPEGLITKFYCLRFETPPTWRTRSPYLYTPGTGWPGYTPRHWVRFSSPPTTRRATVESFHPASTWDWTQSHRKLNWLPQFTCL